MTVSNRSAGAQGFCPAFFCGDTGRAHQGPWQGCTVHTQRVMADYLLVVDGTILAAYVPVEEDGKDPLGDVSSATVRFAVPVELFGRPHREWTITLLASGQDDRGGAGIGEFRSVEADGGEWVGGGKSAVGSPNVYDSAVTRARSPWP